MLNPHIDRGATEKKIIFTAFHEKNGVAALPSEASGSYGLLLVQFHQPFLGI